MSSILTNNSAMVALQTLKSINSQLGKTQSDIATGKTVEDAAASLDWEPGDLLYVGSSRLAQPFHLFLGSTAAKMLRVLAVPMIVVPRGA